MTFSAEQIEAITTSVLRELASRGVAVAAAEKSGTPADAVAPIGVASSPDQRNAVVALTGKVISEQALVAINASGLTITIPAGAIITPSGHDYIRRNGITVTSVLSTGKSAAGGTIIVVGNCFAATSAAKTAMWTTITAGCEFDAAKKSRKQLPNPVVCCGGEPSVTACLLNRNSDVRVAVVTQNTDVSRLVRVMNPQVICLDAAGWSYAQLLKLLRMMPFGATIPASWKEIAGGVR